MTSLIFHTEKEMAFVVMDTLATSVNGEPFMFTTKSFPLPHLKMIICGTGMGGFISRWFLKINDGIVVKGIEDLAIHAPMILRGFWEDYKKNNPIDSNLTTTCYHFGFSEYDDQIHSYAFRSQNQFIAEPLDYGCGIKPVVEIPEPYEFPTDIHKIMKMQRESEEKKNKGERVYIGGEIQITHLTKAGIALYSLGQFEDFKDIESKIFKNYDKNHRKN